MGLGSRVHKSLHAEPILGKLSIWKEMARPCLVPGFEDPLPAGEARDKGGSSEICQEVAVQLKDG